MSERIGDYLATAAQAVVKGHRFPREGPMQTTHRRGYRGVVMLGEKPWTIIDKCPHAHKKKHLAVQCAAYHARYLMKNKSDK